MPGPFAYLNNIPQPTDQLSVSQGQLLTNAASIQSLINIDHVDFASVDAGKHNKVTFPITNPASPTFGTTEYALFNEPDAATINQIWLNNPSNLATTQIPLAASTLNIVAAPASNATSYSYLPSGFILQWGTASNATSPIPAVTFVFPFPNQCMGVFLTGTGGSHATYFTTGYTRTGVNISFFNPNGAGVCNWLAIGY